MEANVKHFRKRDAILACLRQTDQHPSAETVHTMLKPEIPDLSLGTVYRNLTLFKQQGLIQSLGAVKGVERFDGNVEPHVHFICGRCGRIQDLPQIRIPLELSESAAKEAGAAVSSCCLTFMGTCNTCEG